MNHEDEFTLGFVIREPRERIMLICPDCGVVEGADKERWAAQAIFVNNPPVCTGCGVVMLPVADRNMKVDDSSRGV